MAIYITGDTHCDFSRFREGFYPELDELTKKDYVIICGDFGGVWCGDDNEKRILDWLDAKPYTTLFVTGNHENYDILNSLPVSEWHGGKVQHVRPDVIHLMRGQIYDICGKRFFTMGGASSHDVCDGILDFDDPQLEEKCIELSRQGALFRINHLSWWKEEMPSPEEFQAARDTLERAGWSVDYIISHCCPTSIQQALRDDMQPDALTDFFEEVWHKCKFTNWFFGHYHANLVIEEKLILLYEQILKLM